MTPSARIARVVTPPESAMSDHATPFPTLLYRYLFYGWLFRDARRGNLLERAAALRHNQAQARWLPTYLRRSLVIAGVLFVLAFFTESVLAAPVLSACFYVPSCLSVTYHVVTAVCWAMLLRQAQ